MSDSTQFPSDRPGSGVFEGWSDLGRWTIILPSPTMVRALPWKQAADWSELVAGLSPGEPWDVPSEAPFAGGWVGFVSYDASAIALGAELWSEPPPEPPVWFARHDSGILIEPGGRRWEIGDLPGAAIQAAPLSTKSSGAIEDSMSEGYASAVERIRSEIEAGDVYQVNLTRRLRVDGHFDGGGIYQALKGEEPPLSSAFLRGAGWSIASASPEVLLVHDRATGIAESRPIKGTIGIEDDEATAAGQLLSSAKDASEHLMIVDLVRNDLGTIARPGSVHVPESRAIRRVGNILHLESTVRADVGSAAAVDVLRALLPAGSITGAPKRRAVDAIRRLEPVSRGVYTGAIGWIDDRGRSRFSVGIRTAIIAPDHVRYHAGGGIVWDSESASEDAESRLKAEAFLRWSRS